MSIYGRAFASAPRATQETLVALQESWAAVATALGSQPPTAAALSPGQDAAVASAALDAWDAWATASNAAPGIVTVLGRNPPAIAPGWPAVEARAAQRSADLAGAITGLRGAYDVVRRDTVLSGLGADDRASLWWLDERLRALPTQPEPEEGSGSGWAWLAVGIGLALALGRRRR
jgi:MYXO-CTERM domain-containing protein